MNRFLPLLALLLAGPLAAQTIPVRDKTPPLPPKSGEEEAWIRRWCSVGWREYGWDHIERCLQLTELPSEPTPESAGETPEQVRQRLEEYRQRVRDTEIYLQQKKEREYAETWQRYGSTEVKRKGWRRQADGSWVTEAKFDSAPAPTPAASTPSCLPVDSLRCRLKALDSSEAEPPLRPNSDQPRSVPPPRRFDQSLDDLVRDGVVTPSDRSLMRSGGSSFQPLDVGAFQRGCRSRALSARECRDGTPLRWGRSSGNPKGNAPIPRWGPDQIGVNCTSLVVNTYRYGAWRTWERPAARSPYELLVIDRCSSQVP